MQLFIVDNPDDTKTVLKHVVLADKESKLRVEQISELSHGIVFKINYGTNFANGSKAWQYMLKRLPGFQCKYFQLVPAAVPKIG